MSVKLPWRSDQLVADTTLQHSQQTNVHAPGGIRTHDLSRRAAAAAAAGTDTIKMVLYKTKKLGYIILKIKVKNFDKRQCSDIYSTM